MVRSPSSEGTKRSGLHRLVPCVGPKEVYVSVSPSPVRFSYEGSLRRVRAPLGSISVGSNSPFRTTWVSVRVLKGGLHPSETLFL